MRNGHGLPRMLMLTAVVLAIGRPGRAEAQCALAPQVGAVFPVAEPSTDNRSLTLGAGPAVSARLACALGRSFLLDGGGDVLYMDRLGVFQFQVGAGVTLGRSTSPTLDILARVGVGTTFDTGGISAVQRDTEFDRTGPTFGAAARGGVSLGASTTLSIEVGIHRLPLGSTTGHVTPPVVDGPDTGITFVPLTLGVEFSL